MLFIWQQGKEKKKKKTNKREEIQSFTHMHTNIFKGNRMVEWYCQVARTELAGGLRPDLMGQVSALQKPQAPFAGFLAATEQGLMCSLTNSGESLGENLGTGMGRMGMFLLLPVR